MLKSSSPMFGKRDESAPPTVLMNQGGVATPSPSSAARTAASHSTSSHAQSGAHDKDKSGDKGGDAGNRMVVGPDVRLKGAEILDCDTLVVEGHVEATIDSRIIRIAEHGEFIGKVGIDVAEIRGTFNGDLHVREQLIIHSTGKVSGTIRYGKLLIEEGGELCGDIQTITAETKKSSTSASTSTPLPPVRSGLSTVSSEQRQNTGS